MIPYCIIVAAVVKQQCSVKKRIRKSQQHSREAFFFQYEINLMVALLEKIDVLSYAN